MSETAKNRLAYQAEAREWTAPYQPREGVIGAPAPVFRVTRWRVEE